MSSGTIGCIIVSLLLLLLWSWLTSPLLLSARVVSFGILSPCFLCCCCSCSSFPTRVRFVSFARVTDTSDSSAEDEVEEAKGPSIFFVVFSFRVDVGRVIMESGAVSRMVATSGCCPSCSFSIARIGAGAGGVEDWRRWLLLGILSELGPRSRSKFPC